MNFFKFHLGDYYKKASHLSMLEDGAYRRLIDIMYLREGPLPLDKEQIYRLVKAFTKQEKAAVDSVLTEFFFRTDGGYSNTRCEDEIETFRSKSAKASQSASTRWSNANAYANASANAVRSQEIGNAPTNHKPVTSNSIGVVGLARAREPTDDLEAKLREAAGWQRQPAPMLHVTGEIQALIDSGADLDTDVLPIVKALAEQATPTSWKYFVRAIARARDSRIAASNVISHPSSNRSSSHATNRNGKPSRAETFDAIDRRIAEIAEAERAEARRGKGGTGNAAEGAA